MSDRGRGRGAPRGGYPRGGGGGGGSGNFPRGGGRGGHRGGGQGGGRGGGPGGGSDRPKKEAILDLAKYVDKRIRVKFAGGREVQGILKGYDQLMNLVMDEVEETLRDPETGEITAASKTRALGLAVLRGTALTVINPADGFESIENPFASAE